MENDSPDHSGTEYNWNGDSSGRDIEMMSETEMPHVLKSDEDGTFRSASDHVMLLKRSGHRHP